MRVQAIEDPAWEAYISKALDAVNKDGSVVISQAYKVEKFLILPRDFSVDGGELTATLKLKRAFVDDKYQKSIDAMFVEGAGRYVKYRG
jgi:long-subunit acyl-CoA synthetase (AMP-forming)